LSIGQATSDVLITNISPGIFTVKGDGTGVPVGSVAAVTSDGSSVTLSPFQCGANGCQIVPLGLPNDLRDFYLVLYGTGIRNFRSVSASIGDSAAEVAFVGSQAQYPGLDQVNLHLKGPLALSGVQSVRVQVDGVASNSVDLLFP
jgi:uncharacterized protein (TIGR03437 family)